MKNDRVKLALLLALAVVGSALTAGVSNASPQLDPSNIHATVDVLPFVELDCTPNPYVVGDPKVKVVTCVIEATNFDTTKIIPSSLRLSLVERPVTPIAVSAKSPNSFGDFDHDHKTDLKVTFDKAVTDTWFSDLYHPTVFTYRLTGAATGYEDFTMTEPAQVVNPSYTFVHFYAQGGSVDAIKGIDLARTTITSSVLQKSGHQIVKLENFRLVSKFEDVMGTVSGKTQVTVFSRTVSLPFSAWVNYEDGDCTFTPYASIVCDGTGTFYKRGLAVGYSWERVSIHFEVNAEKATLVAREGDTVVFSQTNVPVRQFDYVIQTNRPFLFID